MEYTENQLALAKAIHNKRIKLLYPALGVTALGLVIASVENVNLDATPIALVVIGLAGLLAFGITVLKLKQDPDYSAARLALKKEFKAIKAMIANDNSIHKAEMAKVKAAKAAQSTVSSIEKAHKKQVENTEKELAELLDERGKRISSVGGVTLYERYIVSPQGSGSLIGVHATSEDNTSLSKRITATRMLAFGVFALAAPKKKGAGHAYVVFDGPEISGVATVAGSSNNAAGPQAATFAAKINNSARAAALWQESKPAEEKRLRDALEQLSKVKVAEEEKALFQKALQEVPEELQAKYFDKK